MGSILVSKKGSIHLTSRVLDTLITTAKQNSTTPPLFELASVIQTIHGHGHYDFERSEDVLNYSDDVKKYITRTNLMKE